MGLRLILIILCLWTQAGLALEAFIWRQNEQALPVLMPLKEGQTPKQAIDDYFTRLHASERLKDIVENEEIADLRVGQTLQYEYGTTEVFDFKASKKPRFIIVTNELTELYGAPYNETSAIVSRRLKEAGAEVILLPALHDINLNAPDGKLYRQKIIDSFDAMLILGGTDIDPYLYGDKVTHALHVNRRRDVSELKFTKQFIEAEKGMSFGICRGHQMCAVSHGNQLVQDIQIERDAPMLHRDGEHLIAIDNQSAIFSDFSETQVNVNSYHHQEVVIPENDPKLRVTATSLDETPIVEAAEFKNGLGASLQFHPELMEDEVGEKIMRRFVRLTAKNKYSKIGCHELFKLIQ